MDSNPRSGQHRKNQAAKYAISRFHATWMIPASACPAAQFYPAVAQPINRRQHTARIQPSGENSSFAGDGPTAQLSGPGSLPHGPTTGIQCPCHPPLPHGDRPVFSVPPLATPNSNTSAAAIFFADNPHGPLMGQAARQVRPGRGGACCIICWNSQPSNPH